MAIKVVRMPSRRSAATGSAAAGSLDLLYRKREILEKVFQLLAEYSAIGQEEGEPECGREQERECRRVLLVSAEPMVAEGFRSLLSGSDLRLAGVCAGVAEALLQLETAQPELLVLHPASSSILDDVSTLRSRCPECAIVLWVERISLNTAGRAVEIGVRGILPTTSAPAKILQVLRSIASGEPRVDLPSRLCVPRYRNAHLSIGQRNLVALLGQGLKNKEIATVMGSTVGTVKTSLNRLFKTLGAKDRFEVALYALEEQAAADAHSAAAATNCELESGPAPLISALLTEN
jgi:DNA-binding NarL/FixJ family response regulator